MHPFARCFAAPLDTHWHHTIDDFFVCSSFLSAEESVRQRAFYPLIFLLELQQGSRWVSRGSFHIFSFSAICRKNGYIRARPLPPIIVTSRNEFFLYRNTEDEVVSTFGYLKRNTSGDVIELPLKPINYVIDGIGGELVPFFPLVFWSCTLPLLL